ncbi:uncharacterized protein LOC114535481 [Dendronephthya gigantea]|uniref:uncharacterized protein LOC114535481 n=1 Tax=Dendronephthya gigantea TaxID=151771 RepID=UPI00106913DE|nr:uncharacterized protein LOC114535481 [Dendronephthya gigantea]
MGGPTKEYFHIAISSLTRMDPAFNIQLFGGKLGHLIPICGVDAVASGCFEMVGKLVAHSVLHDGPGFIGLSPAIVKYLTNGSLEAAKEVVTTSDLLDIDLKILQDEKVINTCVSEIDPNAKDLVEGLLVKHGLTDVSLTDKNKEKAVKDLLVAEVLVTRTAALDSMFRGLNHLGLGNLLRQYPIFKEVVLPSIEEAVVDVELLKRKLSDAMKKHRNSRDLNSDDAANEDKTCEWLMKFLDEVSDLFGKLP